jgi:hypothetical protein
MTAAESKRNAGRRGATVRPSLSKPIARWDPNREALTMTEKKGHCGRPANRHLPDSNHHGDALRRS